MLTTKKLAAILTAAAISVSSFSVTSAAEAEPTETEAAVTTEAVEAEAPETEVAQTEEKSSDLVIQEMEERKDGTYYYSYNSSAGTATITDFSAETTDTELVIPTTLGGYTVTAIDDAAFYDCSSLLSVTIPDTVVSIGDSAFGYCVCLTDVTIGSGVTSIGDNAFSNCRSLTSITIPASVTTIGDEVFRSNIRLKSINVEAANQNYKSVDGVLFTKSLKTLIAYPAGKTDTSYTIPSSVTILEDYAFDRCKSLKSVTIPNGVTTIGTGAFYNCNSLTSITIPDSVLNINDYAFAYCYSLASIVIGEGVASIGDYAFKDCTALTNVYYTGTKTYWNYISIGSYSNSYLTDTAKTYNYIPAPVISKAQISGKSVTINWSTVSNATSYRVYRAESATGTKTLLKAVTTTSYTDTTAEAGKTYYYFVKAYKASNGNLSPYSAAKSVTMPSAPTAPASVNAVSGGGNATITWNEVNGATSYRVFRSTSATGLRTRVAIRTSTYYIDKDVDTGTTYYYWVQAYNANTGLTSAYSASTSTKIVNTFNTKPVITKASVLSTSVTLKWDVVPGATSYHIYRRNDAGTRVLIATQSMTEFKDTGLTKGKAYMYEIKAYSATTKASSPWSVIKNVRPMAAPTIQSGNVLGKITWDKNAVATSYRVYRADSLAGAKKLLTATQALQFRDTTAVSGNTYYYFVAAYDNTTGTLSAYSQPKVIKIA